MVQGLEEALEDIKNDVSLQVRCLCYFYQNFCVIFVSLVQGTLTLVIKNVISKCFLFDQKLPNGHLIKFLEISRGEWNIIFRNISEKEANLALYILIFELSYLEFPFRLISRILKPRPHYAGEI